MKSSPPQEQSDSLKKALAERKPFDEAEYYKSLKVEMGGDDVLKDDPEEVEEDDDDYFEENEFYGDDD